MEKNNVVMLGVIFLSLYVNVAKIVLVQKRLFYNQLIKHILCTIITHSHFRNTQKQNFCRSYIFTDCKRQALSKIVMRFPAFQSSTIS